METMSIRVMETIFNNIHFIKQYRFSPSTLKNRGFKALPQYLQDLGNKVLNGAAQFSTPNSTSLILENGLKLTFYNNGIYFSVQDGEKKWSSYQVDNETYYYRDKPDKEMSPFYSQVIHTQELFLKWSKMYDEFKKQVALFDEEDKRVKEEKNHALFAQYTN